MLSDMMLEEVRSLNKQIKQLEQTKINVALIEDRLSGFRETERTILDGLADIVARLDRIEALVVQKGKK